MSARMASLLAAAALVLGGGCFYDFNLAEKIACPATGECDTGFSCLGGECVNSTRARCTPRDRRCIGDVLWTCGTSGESETGEDCAADGKVCASGACLPECRADGGCASGEQCDSVKKVCVPAQECAGDGQCDAARNEGCFAGVCVTRPTLAHGQAALACYPATARPAFTFSGVVKRLGGLETPAEGALLDAALATDVAFTADAAGVFATAKEIAAGTIPVVRFSRPETLAYGLHYGPEIQSEVAESVLLTALLRDDVRTLVGTEAPRDGPGYDFKGRGLLAGRVRDCTGAPLQGATVGFGTPVGRKGYLGAPEAKELRRLGQTSTVEGMGSFVAFDAPVGVDFKVVVVALALETGGSSVPVVVSAQRVRIEAPPQGFDWGVTLVSAGRGPTR